MGTKNKHNQKPKISRKIALVASVVFLLLILTLNWYFRLTAPMLPSPPLKDLAAKHNIELGAHIDTKKLNERIFPELISSQFGFVTLDGGGSQFREIHPAKEKYDFTRSDQMVAYAEQHNMPVQFHHLAWGDEVSLPDWLLKGKYSKEELLNILHDHIDTVVSHYKNRIKEYSVVNEAITEDQHVYNLHNWWADHLGSDYMDKAFIWAHQADPNAKLLLNDFNDETKNDTSDAIYNYIKSAKARGVPIDGVGVQLHVNAQYPIDKQSVMNNLNRFASINIPVYITEFDVNTNKVKASGAEKQKLEASIAGDSVRACIESKNCVSFAVFGITSKNDIIKTVTRANSRAYMFDSRFRPRLQFYAFRQAWQDS